jgi:hypothetical protein
LSVPAWIVRASWVAVAVSLVTFALTIRRVPVPWFDENNLASAAWSIARGGTGVPTMFAPGLAFTPFTRMYGPVFFRLSAWSIAVFGIGPFAIRIVSLTGATAAIGTAAWLTRVLGAPRGWPAVVAALLALSPELGTIATSGRMDALAVALELGWLAAIVSALRATSTKAAVNRALVAAGFMLAGSLTTPRTLPLVVFTFASIASLLLFRRWRVHAAIVAVICAAVMTAGWMSWTATIGTTPIRWVQWQARASQSDQLDRGVPGVQRVYSVDTRNGVTPSITAVAVLTLAVLVALRRRRMDGPVVVTVAATLGVAALYLAFANRVFASPSYFVVPAFVSVVAASVASTGARHERGVLIAWLAVAAIFTAGRVVKDVEIAQTWTFRDPATLNAFVRQWIPRGSIVYGYDQYYFYAVETNGSTFRTYELKPASIAPIVIGEGFDSAHASADPSGPGRFLLWPASGPMGLVPDPFTCAAPHVVATFSTVSRPVVGIERLGIFDPGMQGLHGYPDTVLYAVPPGCPTDRPKMLQ